MPKPPIAVLVLPRAVEELPWREQAEALLRAPGVVAIEPGPLSAFLGRMPDRSAERLARGQARRLAGRLPGRPVAVLAFGALEWPLAREIARRTSAEVWYGRPDPGTGERPGSPRLRELDAQAAEAAAVTFLTGGDEEEERLVAAGLRERLGLLGVDA